MHDDARKRELNQRVQRHEDGTKEYWRDVPGYEGLYRVSDRGRVKSLDRMVWNGYTWREKDGRVLKQLNSNDYRCVSLYGKKKKDRHVHRLVAESFISNPNAKREVNHINGVRHDNRVCNLEWVTHKENYEHACSMGIIPYPKPSNKHYAEIKSEGMPLVREIIKPVPGHEGVLEASNFGAVYSLPRKGRCKRIKLNSYGGVHVWTAFNGPIPKSYKLVHLDGDRSNSRLDNIIVATHAAMMRRASERGCLTRKEIRCWNETPSDVQKQIKAKYATAIAGKRRIPYGFVSQLSKELGVSTGIISRIGKEHVRTTSFVQFSSASPVPHRFRPPDHDDSWKK